VTITGIQLDGTVLINYQCTAEKTDITMIATTSSYTGKL